MMAGIGEDASCFLAEATSSSSSDNLISSPLSFTLGDSGGGSLLRGNTVSRPVSPQSKAKSVRGLSAKNVTDPRRGIIKTVNSPRNGIVSNRSFRVSYNAIVA